MKEAEDVLGHVILGGTAINYAAGTPTVVLFPKYTESLHTFPAALPEPYLTTLSITKGLTTMVLKSKLLVKAEDCRY